MNRLLRALGQHSDCASCVVVRLAVVTQKGGSHFTDDFCIFTADIAVHVAVIQKWCMRNQVSNALSVSFRLSTTTHISDRSGKGPVHQVAEWIVFNLFHWRKSVLY